MTTEPRKAAVSLIQREDLRVLCVWNLRYNGFSLPGGMVEDGETVNAALRRELREETSLEIVTAEKVFEGAHHLRPETNERSGRASVVAIFRVTASGEPREVEPGCRIAWLTWEEFLTQSPFGAFYREIMPHLALGLPRPSPRLWPPHEFVQLLAEAVDHMFDPHDYPWEPQSKKRIHDAREAARAWLVDFGDCTMTERSSAYDAFKKICELAEHDSPIYRVAVEELSALGHAQRRAPRQVPPSDVLPPVCEDEKHTWFQGTSRWECSACGLVDPYPHIEPCTWKEGPRYCQCRARSRFDRTPLHESSFIIVGRCFTCGARCELNRETESCIMGCRPLPAQATPQPTPIHAVEQTDRDAAGVLLSRVAHLADHKMFLAEAAYLLAKHRRENR